MINHKTLTSIEENLTTLVPLLTLMTALSARSVRLNEAWKAVFRKDNQLRCSVEVVKTEPECSIGAAGALI